MQTMQQLTTLIQKLHDASESLEALARSVHDPELFFGCLKTLSESPEDYHFCSTSLHQQEALHLVIATGVLLCSLDTGYQFCKLAGELRFDALAQDIGYYLDEIDYNQRQAVPPAEYFITAGEVHDLPTIHHG